MTARRGPGNPRASQWYSTPAARRNRRQGSLTLPEEAWARLDELVAEAGAAAPTRSALIEAWIRQGGPRQKKSDDE